VIQHLNLLNRIFIMVKLYFILVLVNNKYLVVILSKVGSKNFLSFRKNDFLFVFIDEDNDENENEEEKKEDKEEEVGEEEEEEDNADDSIPDDEHVNDLERAFEILECAHMIYSKMIETEPNDAHIITRLGDIHVMLADICNENGDHENALLNVLKAIELQETINEQQRYRLLAESYYKLGLIYELINKFSEAVDSFDKAINAVRQAVEQATGDEKENEREELKSLLPAIELKRNDAQASIADKHLIAQARNMISGTNATSHTTDNSTTEAPAKDLTLTLRHKRPATDLEKTDEENKKSKTEEN
jgi:tetratricopeptide (TPR) repeat protein